MSKDNITIDGRYMHPLFFRESVISLPLHYDQEAVYSPLFQPDLQAAYHGYKPPWKSFEKWLNVLLNEWNHLKIQLQTLHKERSKGAEPIMVKGLSLFFMMFYWSNGRAVNLKDWETSVLELEISFVNPIERLSFIVSQPNTYFAFRQLDEIFSELHKTIAKNMNKIRKST